MATFHCYPCQAKSQLRNYTLFNDVIASIETDILREVTQLAAETVNLKTSEASLFWDAFMGCKTCGTSGYI